MLSTDREEFDNLVRVLCAGFGPPATPERIDAYWRGCNTMPLMTFSRVIDMALREYEPDRYNNPPAVPVMWQFFRELRNRGSAPNGRSAGEQTDPLTVFASRTLLAFMMRKGWPPKASRERWQVASDASMQALLHIKNNIVATARADGDLMRDFLSPDGTPEAKRATKELSDVLIRAFESHFQPRLEAEFIADFECFARTGRSRGCAQEDGAA